MFKIIREFHFSYGHRILNHPGKCARLHGHNARVEVELSAPKLDQLSMVVDFYEVKKTLGTWIDSALDHRTLLSKIDPLVKAIGKSGDHLVVIKQHPTAEVMAKIIFDQARKLKLPVTRVTFWETDTSAATYEKP